jgi:hypothetical protein
MMDKRLREMAQEKAERAQALTQLKAKRAQAMAQLNAELAELAPMINKHVQEIAQMNAEHAKEKAQRVGILVLWNLTKLASYKRRYRLIARDQLLTQAVARGKQECESITDPALEFLSLIYPRVAMLATPKPGKRMALYYTPALIEADFLKILAPVYEVFQLSMFSLSFDSADRIVRI